MQDNSTGQLGDILDQQMLTLSDTRLLVCLCDTQGTINKIKCTNSQTKYLGELGNTRLTEHKQASKKGNRTPK